MTLALVIGSAFGNQNDVETFARHWIADVTIVVNRVVEDYPFKIDAAVTLHPRLMVDWRDTRQFRELPNIPRWVAHRNRQGGQKFEWVTHVLPYLWPEQTVSGSSGHYAIMAAVELFGASKVVLAGVPMDGTLGHYYDKRPWNDSIFRPAWEQTYDRLKDTVRSMSGWTAHKFGKPTQEWIES